MIIKTWKRKNSSRLFFTNSSLILKEKKKKQISYEKSRINRQVRPFLPYRRFPSSIIVHLRFFLFYRRITRRKIGWTRVSEAGAPRKRSSGCKARCSSSGAPLCLPISSANQRVSQPARCTGGRVHVERVGGRGKRMKRVEFVGYEFPRAGPPRRRPGTEACRIRVPCICNEGCAPPTRRWQCRCARCIKAQPMADYRRSRPRASNSFYAPRYLSSPGH